MSRTARPPLAPAGFVRALAVALALATGVAAAAPPAPPHAATGSHRYRLVLLTAGERPSLPTTVAESLQAGHLANIRAMFRSGVLDAAGHFGDQSPLIGLFVSHAENADLDLLLAPDPILHAGRLVAQAHRWIAPEGLGEAYRRTGTFDPGGRDSMVSFSFVLLHRGPRWTANVTPDLPAALVARDPAVKAGRLTAEIHPWWTAYGVVPCP